MGRLILRLRPRSPILESRELYTSSQLGHSDDVNENLLNPGVSVTHAIPFGTVTIAVRSGLNFHGQPAGIPCGDAAGDLAHLRESLTLQQARRNR
jgi:hypothetical protein